MALRNAAVALTWQFDVRRIFLQHCLLHIDSDCYKLIYFCVIEMKSGTYGPFPVVSTAVSFMAIFLSLFLSVVAFRANSISQVACFVVLALFLFARSMS